MNILVPIKRTNIVATRHLSWAHFEVDNSTWELTALPIPHPTGYGAALRRRAGRGKIRKLRKGKGKEGREREARQLLAPKWVDRIR